MILLDRLGSFFDIVFHLASAPASLAILFGSVLLGIIFGAMPGLTSTLGVALASLLLLTPFSVNSFVQGHHLLGFGSLAIVAVLAAVAAGAVGSRAKSLPCPEAPAAPPADIALLTEIRDLLKK